MPSNGEVPENGQARESVTKRSLSPAGVGERRGQNDRYMQMVISHSDSSINSMND
jgi:hypothetical protein